MIFFANMFISAGVFILFLFLREDYLHSAVESLPFGRIIWGGGVKP